ncbi:MAG TPA: AAA family ATPase [Streptosporangiaceae bacterium]
MAGRVHYSPTTLADAAGGERLPSLEVALAYVTACGGNPDVWNERWRAVAAHVAGTGARHAEPYPGPAPFRVADADRFFGREKLTEELVDRIKNRSFTVVTGDSGCGKSSLLRAGLLARINGESWSPGRWRTIVMTPTDRPLRELARRAAELDDAEAEPLEAELTTGGAGALEVALRQILAGRHDDTRILVVVDQFEEVFRRCAGLAERGTFIDALLAAAEGECRRVHVVLAVRADYVSRCRWHPGLAAALDGEPPVVVGPMTRAELERAITESAARAGVTVEPELKATVLAEDAHGPGALPLISQALLAVWRARRSQVLTLADYRAHGGIRGSVAASAERLYRRLEPTVERPLARQLFLRLTTLGTEAEQARRRARRAELAGLGADPDAVESVLERLARARLVVIGADTVEVAHEAVIRAWPRLRRWLTEDRDGLLIHRQLTEAARIWESLDRDPGALYRGARLVMARDWAVADEHEAELTVLEREFLAAAIALQAGERRAERRRNLILRYLVAGLVVLLAVAAAGTALAVSRLSLGSGSAPGPPSGASAAAGERRRGRSGAEGRDVALVQAGPVLSIGRRGAVESRLEAVQAGVPARPVPCRLADAGDRVGEHQQAAAVAVRGELETQDVLAPGVGEQARRVDFDDLALEVGNGLAVDELAFAEGEAELAAGDEGPAGRGRDALDPLREPVLELRRIGQRPPDLFHRVPEPALEPQRRPPAGGLQCRVHAHVPPDVLPAVPSGSSGIASRCRSRASSRSAHRRR